MRIILIGILCAILFVFLYSRTPPNSQKASKITISRFSCLSVLCVSVSGYTKCNTIPSTLFEIEEKIKDKRTILILKNTKKECST